MSAPGAVATDVDRAPISSVVGKRTGIAGHGLTVDDEGREHTVIVQARNPHHGLSATRSVVIESPADGVG